MDATSKITVHRRSDYGHVLFANNVVVFQRNYRWHSVRFKCVLPTKQSSQPWFDVGFSLPLGWFTFLEGTDYFAIR